MHREQAEASPDVLGVESPADREAVKKVGAAGLTISVLANISWLSAQLLSLGVIIRLVTGLATVPSTLLGAAVILTISLTGGLWALSRSDMLAFIIMTFVLLWWARWCKTG